MDIGHVGPLSVADKAAELNVLAAGQHLVGGNIMAISAKDVQKLREMTGVGIMNCKNALVEADGDFDKAIELLREKGLAAQVKKAHK